MRAPCECLQELLLELSRTLGQGIHVLRDHICAAPDAPQLELAGFRLAGDLPKFNGVPIIGLGRQGSCVLPGLAPTTPTRAWGGWRGAGRTEHYTAADGSSSADRAALQDKRNNVETEQTQFNTIKRQVRQVQQKQWLKIVNVEMMFCRLFHLGEPPLS